ncbi:peptide chain release factor 3 [Sandaracinus amylolyticus]|uniref:peptide chain release factor 3 n=1 Tax=Sandaracinus amylolyticus TaxID=927083 RepID=UPI001F025AAB|nr:peptide chain release factor 3 [Sandaracinus amylolyticus]UJR79566.1 Peptide chain release factor 3 [Sandaracinus amylolyticus]
MSHEFERRRTFAIIAHPDAGKTTLTEKLLLYGGAIHTAGAVHARKAQRAATSDWMELERKRGISITSSVLQFEYLGIRYNLLDTPGHQDFSEDTYRTLTAADCAIMLIDAAKGVEEQTKKLFHVCRQRGTPIVTFVNKLDRPARDPFALMSEIEEVLGMRTVPRTWPIGSGEDFKGVYDVDSKGVLTFDRTAKNASRVPMQTSGIDDPKIDQLVGEQLAKNFRDEVELVTGAGDSFDQERFLEGEISPVFFGSALTNFGVEPFLEAFQDICPQPGPRETNVGKVEPGEDRFGAFVFKVQANMDPNHRDRIAFVRIVSGKFESGMWVNHYRLGKQIRLARAEQLFAQERQTVHEAWAGDVVGLHDPGIFRIGDTLSTGSPALAIDAVPRFSPEYFARATLLDPLKRKQMQKGIDELAEEGTLQLFFQPGREKDPILGVVGVLQFEVLAYRLQHEYGAKVTLDRLPYSFARWVDGAKDTKELEARRVPLAVTDIDGKPVALLRDEWELLRMQRDNEQWKFLETAPIAPVSETES